MSELNSLSNNDILVPLSLANTPGRGLNSAVQVVSVDNDSVVLRRLNPIYNGEEFKLRKDVFESCSWVPVTPEPT